MFNSIKVITAAFAGRFRSYPGLSRAMWLYLITWAGGIILTIWAAVISEPAYGRLLPFWSWSGTAATFTAAIIVYFTSQYVAGGVACWFRTEDKPYYYHYPTLLTALALGLAVAIFDFRMNIEAGLDRINSANPLPAPSAANSSTSTLSNDLDRIEGGRADIERRHTWRGVVTDPKLWNSADRRRYDELGAQAAALRSQILATSRQTALLDSVQIAQGIQRISSTQTNFTSFTRWLYAVVFLITLLQAFIAQQIDDSCPDFNLEDPLWNIRRGNNKTNHHRQANTQPNGHQHHHQPNGRATLNVKANNEAQILPLTHGNRGSSENGYRITCAHCQTETVMKSPKAKYCSESCRKADYEARTGQPLAI